MAQLNRTFDATTVAPSAPRELIPAGKYIAQIINSEMKDTSTGGQMLVLEFDIVDGEHTGRKLWDRLNLQNRNAQAVEIAERTLSAICHATGRLNIADSEDLHFVPMLVTVKVDPPRTDARTGKEYGASNSIGGYEAAPGYGAHQPRGGFQPRAVAPVAAAPAYVAPAAPAQAPVAAGSRPAPWSRKAG